MVRDSKILIWCLVFNFVFSCFKRLLGIHISSLRLCIKFINLSLSGISYCPAIDIWSLGCILAELFTGYPLFPGENEVEQLACVMEIFGLPPKELVDKAQRRRVFFGEYSWYVCTLLRRKNQISLRIQMVHSYGSQSYGQCFFFLLWE